jgi:hypothetical protein
VTATSARGADKDECCEETPLEGVFEFELGFDVRSVSIIGGFGDLEGLERLDIVEGDREDGKDERDVLRFAIVLPLEFHVAAAVSVVEVVPLVVGRCISAICSFFDFFFR